MTLIAFKKSQMKPQLHPFLKWALCAWVLGLMVPSLRAADAEEQVATALQVVSLQPSSTVRSLYWRTAVMAKPDKQPRVSFSASTLLPPVKYQGPRKLTLMVDQGGYKPIAEVNLPASCKRTIVVLVPNPAGAALPFFALAMNADPEFFQLGSRRLINLSKAPIRGEVGPQPFITGSKKNRRFLCKPGKIIDVPALDKNAKAWTGYPVILEYYANDKWNILSSSRWFHTPTQRHLVFVYYDTVRKGVMLRGISDSANSQQPGNNKEQGE